MAFDIDLILVLLRAIVIGACLAWPFLLPLPARGRGHQ
jgi:hypothetical protein